MRLIYLGKTSVDHSQMISRHDNRLKSLSRIIADGPIKSSQMLVTDIDTILET